MLYAAMTINATKQGKKILPAFALRPQVKAGQTAAGKVSIDTARDLIAVSDKK